MTWTEQDAAELYAMPSWSDGYFSINAAGNVAVRPNRTSEREIDLFEVIEGLRARDLSTPVVVRISGIIADRVRRLHDAFAHAIDEYAYRGDYLAVYPIKVNQQRHVVEEVYRAGAEFGFGLEVGSKPELLAVLALTSDASQRPVICNGFKDDAYIEACVLATRLGRRIIPVIENYDEIGLIVDQARKHGVCPDIGVRIKLASQGVGRWAASTGVKSKFGLSASQILDLVERLRAEDLLDHLKLVHCHPGSQLHDIRRVKASVDELAHVFVELKKLGAPLDYIDVGGGLAVDYEGNTSRSMNYTLEEYAKDIVYRVGLICDSADVAHPVIVSESGRAVSAYSSVLVFNALGSRTVDATIPDAEVDVPDDAPAPIADLASAYESIYEHNIVEVFHDAEQAYEQSMQLFSLGYLSLAERALAERLYWAVCARIRQIVPDPGSVSPELASLPTHLCDIYFANVSIFQSLPDNWAIEQQFPIMPIQRLGEAPTRTATLADITCDSDGKVDTFVTRDGISPTLPVHVLNPGQPYYIGVFIVGAYQETLGGLHNLFGDAHVVNVQSEPDGRWSIVDIIRGDTAAELLEYMQFDVDELYPNIWRDCERAVRDGRMTLQESQVLRRFYETELGSYSYLRHPATR